MFLQTPNRAAALRRATKGNPGDQTGSRRVRRGASGGRGGFEALGISSLAGLAVALNETHIKTARWGKWHACSTRNLLHRPAVLSLSVPCALLFFRAGHAPGRRTQTVPVPLTASSLSDLYWPRHPHTAPLPLLRE